MDTVLSPEKLPINRKRLIGELTSGRDSAKELQILLHRQRDNHGSELVVKILRSFNDSLSALSLGDSGELSDQIPANFRVGSTCSGDRTSEEYSGESKKRPVAKDRRGCYKRRKTSDSWIKISHIIEDGYAWRKYGQKEILNAKHPRCYFRCTHKNDQGCKANKQVQKLEDDPNLFHITYFGHHTCRNLHKPTQMFSDSQALNSYILNFEESKPHRPSNVPSLVKQEPKAQSEDLSDNVSSSTLWKEIIAFDSSHDQTGAVMGYTFDHEDSCASTSSHGLDMETYFRSVGTFVSDFDKFDEMEFL